MARQRAGSCPSPRAGASYGSDTEPDLASVGASSVGSSVRAASPRAFLSRTLGAPVRGLQSVRARAVTKFDQTHDEILDRQVSRIIATAGGVAKESAKAAYMPPRVAGFVDGVMTRMWEEVGEELKSGIMASYGRTDKKHRELRLSQWAKAPPLQLDNIPAWVRAKVLYATQPADATIWKVTQDPVNASILAIKLLPFFGVNVLIFAYLFANIDRKDEYQLVQFILSFKGFQFITALSLAVKGALKFYYCLNQGAIDPTGGDQFDIARCSLVTPGGYSAYIYSLELLRCALLFTAAHLLASGKAYGGLGEIRALEQVRLDMADGSLDGDVDRKKMLRDKKTRLGSV